MKDESWMPGVVRWVATGLAFPLVLGFLYSTQRAISWTSPSCRYEVSLMCGAVLVGWKAPDWRLAEEKYPPQPGWVVASYAGAPELIVRPRVGEARKGRWLELPLWIPLVPAAAMALVMWYRRRGEVVEFAWRQVRRLTPEKSPRMRVALWGACCLVHWAGVISLAIVLSWLVSFLNRPILPERLFPVLFFGAPLFAVLWAWLWVRFRRWIWATQRTHHCPGCGYDLAGNESGRCPECGLSGARRADVENPYRS